MGNKKQSTRKDPRTKKRTPFKGNRYTYRASSQAQEVVIPGDEAQDVVIPGDEANTVDDSSPPAISASAKKLRLSVEGQYIDVIDDVNSSNEPTLDNGYVLFDISIFINLISDVGKCQNCGADVTAIHQIDGKKGFCHLFKLSCDKNCGWYKSVYTSKEINKGKQGRKAFDVNIRSVVAFREIGKGHAAIETLCGYMNMPPPMNQTTYDDIITQLHGSYMKLANANMKAAADEIRHQNLGEEYAEDNIANIDISADGTWQRRGYASLNGAVTVIGMDNGKYLAFQALTKVCKSCQTWELHKGTDKYDEYLKTHDCPINHHGSVGSMEASGIIQCFKRSVATNKVRYTTYWGWRYESVP